MPLTYLVGGYEANRYEAEARAAVEATRERAAGKVSDSTPCPR